MTWGKLPHLSGLLAVSSLQWISLPCPTGVTGMWVLVGHTLPSAKPCVDMWSCLCCGPHTKEGLDGERLLGLPGQKEGLRMNVLQPNTKLGTASSGNQKYLLCICMELYTFRSPFPFILSTAHLASSNKVYKTASLTMISSVYGITLFSFWVFFFFFFWFVLFFGHFL